MKRIAYMPNETITFGDNKAENKRIVHRLASEYDDALEMVRWLEGKYPHYDMYGVQWMGEALFDFGAYMEDTI